jgi:hypothetical protein
MGVSPVAIAKIVHPPCDDRVLDHGARRAPVSCCVRELLRALFDARLSACGIMNAVSARRRAVESGGGHAEGTAHPTLGGTVVGEAAIVPRRVVRAVAAAARLVAVDGGGA